MDRLRGRMGREGAETGNIPPWEDFPQFAAVLDMGDVLKADLFMVGFLFIWHNTISCNELMTGSNLFFFSRFFLAFSLFSLFLCVCV